MATSHALPQLMPKRDAFAALAVQLHGEQHLAGGNDVEEPCSSHASIRATAGGSREHTHKAARLQRCGDSRDAWAAGEQGRQRSA